MSKSLFEEAIADARQLREAAEQNAKNAIIEAVTPRIRELIENQLVGGNSINEDADFLSSALDEEQEGEEVELDESALRSLAGLLNSGSSKKSKDFAALSEAFSSLTDDEQNKLMSMLREEDEKSNAEKAATGEAYEIDLDELKASIVSEAKHSKKLNGDKSMKKGMKDIKDMDVMDEDLYELDEMMNMDDDDDLDEAVFKIFGTTDEKQMASDLFPDIDFVEEEGEGEEVEVAEEEPGAEAPPAEGEPAEMAEAVYEIDENMLRRELMRLREAKSGKKKGSSHASHTAAANAFGGGTLEGDVLEVEINKTAAKTEKMKHALMKEARENRALRQQLNDYRGAVETLREQLSDLNLFNAKLLYVNKILQNKDVAPNQRRAIIEALDGASNLREAKLLYESLSTSITKKNESLNESVKHTAGLASRPVTSSAARMSGADEVDRWATLAGIK